MKKDHNNIIFLNKNVVKYFKNNKKKFNNSFQSEVIVKETYTDFNKINNNNPKALLIPNKAIILYNEIKTYDPFDFIIKFKEYGKNLFYNKRQLKNFLARLDFFDEEEMSINKTKKIIYN